MMKKNKIKIGIITFHFGYNYGGVLQCIALQNILEERGCDVEVIDYRKSKKRKSFYYLRGWGIETGKISRQKIVNRYHALKFEKSSKMEFEIFRNKKMKLSKLCSSQNELAEIVNKYDLIITGSDQVWNRSYTTDMSYLLDFINVFHGKRMSYAACSGQNKKPEKDIDEIRKAIDNINFLSVRNQVTYDWVNELTGKNPAIVADPTLLYNFNSFVKSSVSPIKKYILMYVLQDEIEGGHKEAIKQIRKVRGNLPIVNIVLPPHHPYFCPFAKYNIQASIKEWISLIANADFVYTNSFHGALFAMKYKKQFLAYYSSASRSLRLIDIGDRFKVNGVITSGVSDSIIRGCFKHNLNYNEVDDAISNSVMTSIDFLKNSLDCVHQNTKKIR